MANKHFTNPFNVCLVKKKYFPLPHSQKKILHLLGPVALFVRKMHFSTLFSIAHMRNGVIILFFSVYFPFMRPPLLDRKIAFVPNIKRFLFCLNCYDSKAGPIAIPTIHLTQNNLIFAIVHFQLNSISFFIFTENSPITNVKVVQYESSTQPDWKKLRAGETTRGSEKKIKSDQQ